MTMNLRSVSESKDVIGDTLFKFPYSLPITTLVSAVPGSTSADNSSCEAGWSYYSDYCYLAVCEGTDEQDSRAYCLGMGADLTSISDSNELDFVVSISCDSMLLACA